MAIEVVRSESYRKNCSIDGGLPYEEAKQEDSRWLLVWLKICKGGMAKTSATWLWKTYVLEFLGLCVLGILYSCTLYTLYVSRL